MIVNTLAQPTPSLSKPIKVNPATIPQFMRAGITAVGTGITVFRPDLVAKEDYEGIRTLAKMHVDAVRLTVTED